MGFGYRSESCGGQILTKQDIPATIDLEVDKPRHKKQPGQIYL